MRVEFAGAFYHVMARGDRRETIVRDDPDGRPSCAHWQKRASGAVFGFMPSC